MTENTKDLWPSNELNMVNHTSYKSYHLNC